MFNRLGDRSEGDALKFERCRRIVVAALEQLDGDLDDELVRLATDAAMACGGRQVAMLLEQCEDRGQLEALLGSLVLLKRPLRSSEFQLQGTGAAFVRSFTELRCRFPSVSAQTSVGLLALADRESDPKYLPGQLRRFLASAGAANLSTPQEAVTAFEFWKNAQHRAILAAPDWPLRRIVRLLSDYSAPRYEAIRDRATANGLTLDELIVLARSSPSFGGFADMVESAIASRLVQTQDTSLALGLAIGLLVSVCQTKQAQAK